MGQPESFPTCTTQATMICLLGAALLKGILNESEAPDDVMQHLRGLLDTLKSIA